MKIIKNPKTIKSYIAEFLGISLGAFLAALSIQVFLYPNQLIDGGITGLSLIFSRLLGNQYLSYFLIGLNLPFIYLAYKQIRKGFVAYMLIAILLFAAFLSLLQNVPPFFGDTLEIIVIGGALLGSGVGLMIRNKACVDGTESLAIILNKKLGFSIGQIIFFINIFIFGAYGLIFQDWHIAVKSLFTYIVAFKTIDLVLSGFEEVKAVTLMTSNPKRIKELIIHELGLGLTIIPGIGGFSNKEKEILFIIVGRLDLAALKEIVLQEDPTAFMSIQNLHEVAYGKQIAKVSGKKIPSKRHYLLKAILGEVE
ncbi:MAG: YitT family protein [Chlamydiae bacterium]|nr:YitT family protein [Chlamydiota bacterium]